MKKLPALLTAALIVPLFALALYAAETKPAAQPDKANLSVAPLPDYVTKERDEARAQVAQLQAANAQLQQSVNYLQILAERNELALRLVQRQLEDTTARAAKFETDLSLANAELAKAREAAAKPEAKK